MIKYLLTKREATDGKDIRINFNSSICGMVFHETIKMTAEKEGWITTEFKNNALIAEKIKEDDSLSVTITFSKLSFSISPENDNLQKAISKALKI